MRREVSELQLNWALSPGDVLGHYRVIAPLGAGGMGQVYLAEDTRLGRKLALKVLAPQSLATAELIERFDREARSVSALNHPNIITMYDTGQIGGTRFIATEFIDGQDAADAPWPRPHGHPSVPRDRRAGGAGTGCGPCRRRRAPGPEARERHAAPRRLREGARLRPCQVERHRHRRRASAGAARASKPRQAS